MAASPAAGIVATSSVPESNPAAVRSLPPPDLFDPVIEAYKKDVDRTLLRENLKLTPQQRSEQFERQMEMVFELQRHAQSQRERA
jgi:hypothetical protein